MIMRMIRRTDPMTRTDDYVYNNRQDEDDINQIKKLTLRKIAFLPLK